MEYTCLVAGGPSVGVDSVVQQLLLPPDCLLPAALRSKGEEPRQQAVTLGNSSPAGQKIVLFNPSIPQLDICIALHVAHTPAEESVAMCGTPELVLLVFSLFSDASLQYLQVEWKTWLEVLNPVPSVILIGMQDSENGTTTIPIQPVRIASFAKEVHANAYFELTRASDHSNGAALEELRVGIARVCNGEYRGAGDVTEDAVCDCRKRSSTSLSSSPFPCPTGASSSLLTPLSCLSPTVPLGRTTAASTTWGYKRHPRTNRLFYVNRLTRKSQYRRPLDYDGEEPQLTLEERVEAERERKTQLQQELELQREHEELSRFNEAMAEQQQRLKVKQSCARRLEHEVAQLRLHAERLKRLRESNTRSRSQLAQLLEELKANERSLLQSSTEFHTQQQQQLASVRGALQKEGQVEGEMALEMGDSSSASAYLGVCRTGWGEVDALQVTMQTTVDSIRSALTQLRDIVERTTDQREKNAVVHAERLAVVRRTEALLLRATAIDVDDQRVSSALRVARTELTDAEAALAPLLVLEGVQARELCRHHHWAKAEQQEEELLMHQLEQMRVKMAACSTVLHAPRPLGLEDAHTHARLQRRRDVRECATARSKLVSHMLSIKRLQQTLRGLLQRQSGLEQRRVQLIGQLRERYVRERLSLLRRWYALEDSFQHPGSDTVQLRLVEERMEQLDVSIEHLQSYADALGKVQGSHSERLQHAHDVLKRVLDCDRELPLRSNSVVEECWVLLTDRLSTDVEHVKSTLFPIYAEGMDGSAGSGGRMTKDGRRVAFAEHMALLQQELWCCAAQSLLQLFRPEELRHAVRNLSRRHASAMSDTKNDTLKVVVDAYSSISSDKASSKLLSAWSEQLLLSVLSPVMDSHGISESEALAQVEESAAAHESALNDALCRRLQQAYKLS